ncbi:MAG: hypothetical protein GC157_13330 [Frankiales bacterium]|nr:hypothetical protein [Frankiales bacterium]
MRRHDLDWISLIAGAAFAGLALLYLVATSTDLTVDARIVWPVLFVALGAAGVAAAVTATRREESAYARAQVSEAGTAVAVPDLGDAGVGTPPDDAPADPNGPPGHGG